MTIYRIAGIEIHAFTAWIAAGVFVGVAIVLGVAARRHQRLMPWLDAATNAVVGGLIGARAFHVWLNWAYFSVHTDQIIDFGSGGLDWHGAVVGGLLGAILVALASRIPLPPVLDAFALVLPVGVVATWLACAAANSAYGLEVRTLADFPSWLVIESPDVYGIVAPRLNLPPIGIALAAVMLIGVVALTAFGWLSGLRLWLALTFYSLGMAVIDFFRAEYVPTWLGRRADQVLDLALALAAILIFAVAAVLRARGQTAFLKRAKATPDGRGLVFR
jgi:phosphatidylglycerol:prolipoprotein diacylglycerol transferase